MPDYYGNIDRACKARGTTVTQVLKDIGKAKSSGSSWKKGVMPSIDACALIAKHLHISIDELVNGSPYNGPQVLHEATRLSRDEEEWMNLYHQLPEGKRYAVKTFILQMIPESAPPLGEEKSAESTAS